MSTERPNLVRAVVEGLAAQVVALTRSVEAEIGAPLDRLRVDGGLTRSRVLMQAQANLLQVPVDIYPSPHATALGAATMARLALDPSLLLEDAIDHWTPEASFEPQWSADRAADTMSVWETAVQSVLPGKVQR